MSMNLTNYAETPIGKVFAAVEHEADKTAHRISRADLFANDRILLSITNLIAVFPGAFVEH